MRNVFLAVGILFSTLLFTGCGNDDDGGTTQGGGGGGEQTDTRLNGRIIEDITLTADQIWSLDGRVTIVDGVTLTIEPGTIIKAESGASANASVLIIARGATINAVGTASAPIIFTAASDDITVGQTAGSNLDQNDRGLWGGIVILGNAPISVDGNADVAQIEGIPASDTNGLYGGSDAADNSGVFSYVSIRHAGVTLSANNELNGLTLGGVGSGTTISYIEVVANNDDGIEFFGGTVNASNLFVWAQKDDAIDKDQAYSGEVDNVIVVQGEESDHALEIDGPEGNREGSFTLRNVTLIGGGFDGEIADFRADATGSVSNVLVYGFNASADVELDNNGVAQNFLDGDLTFTNWQVVLPEGVETANAIFVEKGACIANCNDDDDDNDELESPIITDFADRATTWTTAIDNPDAATVGADTSQFSWTYSNGKAQLGF